MYGKLSAVGGRSATQKSGVNLKIECTIGGMIITVSNTVREKHHLSGKSALAHKSKAVFGIKKSRQPQFWVLISEKGKPTLRLQSALKGFHDGLFSIEGRGSQ